MSVKPIRKPLLALMFSIVLILQGGHSLPVVASDSASLTWPGQSCTVFYAADGDTILAGNNEDMNNPLTRIWFIPASDGKHGRVFFGFDDFIPQGGINDQGLFYDGLSVPAQPIIQSSDRTPLKVPWMLLDKALAEAATVDEVVTLFSAYNLTGLEASQLLYGDRQGNSVIIEGNAVLPKQGKFQVATNFRQSEKQNQPASWDRFSTATRMLSEADAFTVSLFRDILQATHVDGTVPTLYSQVYDLKRGLIHLYQFHNYTSVVTIDVAAELAKGAHAATIASLFPRDEAMERWTDSQMQPYAQGMVEWANGAVPPEALAEYTGEYRMTEGQDHSGARLFVEGDTLYLQKAGLLPVELYATSEGEFFHPYYMGDELRLTFARDDRSEVRGAEGHFTFLGFSQPIQLERTSPPNRAASRAALLSGGWPWIAAAVVGVSLIALLIMALRRRSRSSL